MMARLLLIHHLLMDFKDDCFFVSATTTDCRLIETKNTTRQRNRIIIFDNGQNIGHSETKNLTAKLRNSKTAKANILKAFIFTFSLGWQL
jgi:hypothetical protein